MNVLADPHNGNEIRGYHGAVSDFKRRLIETTLLAARGNRTHAARTLGLQRTYLLRLIRELRVAAPPPPGRNGRASAEGAVPSPIVPAARPATPAESARPSAATGRPSGVRPVAASTRPPVRAAGRREAMSRTVSHAR